MKLQKNQTRMLGVASCLIGAFLMAFGAQIVGVYHTEVARVMGIFGIGLITAGKKTSLVRKKKEVL